jgi:hypothetical protein
LVSLPEKQPPWLVFSPTISQYKGFSIPEIIAICRFIFYSDVGNLAFAGLPGKQPPWLVFSPTISQYKGFSIPKIITVCLLRFIR